MTRVFIAIVGLIMLLSACTQRLACPAYQSSFIYDKDALRQKFSYFNEDSTPKILTASKSKYLIAVPESYRKKYRRMQTVEMKPVYPKIPDSLRTQDSDMALAEADEPDSAAVAAKAEETEPGDSTYAITKTKEKFNLDQDLYMWYFREMLVLPDVRAAMENKSKEQEGGGEGAKAEKKEKLPFPKNILNIFKKKDKTDSTSTQTTEKKTSTGVNSPPAPEKKGGLFKKKKKKTEDNTPVKKKDPAKKKEEGDGF